MNIIHNYTYCRVRINSINVSSGLTLFFLQQQGCQYIKHTIVIDRTVHTVPIICATKFIIVTFLRSVIFIHVALTTDGFT
jgi:hypothetical protein